MNKSNLPTTETPEYLRSLALRQAPHIKRYGWRPSKEDLAELRASTRDPIAYRILARAWRSAGFKIGAIRRLAWHSRNGHRTVHTALGEIHVSL